MSKDLEFEVTPGLHCWNFMNGRPLDILILMPFDLIQYRRGYFRKTDILNFFECRNPLQEYPQFHKFLTNQCILGCDSYSLSFSPQQVPQDKQACDEFIRNRICEAIKSTNNQIAERCKFLSGLDGTIRFHVSLHSLEVISYSVEKERVHAKIKYSIIFQPSTAILDLDKESLKREVFDLVRPHYFFTCCFLHFKDPGCLRIYSKDLRAVYIDQSQDPMQEEERLFRLLNMIRVPKRSLVNAISRIWNHPAIQKDVQAKQFMESPCLKFKNVSFDWTLQDLYDHPPSTYGIITKDRNLLRILKIIHRIFHSTNKPPSNTILNTRLNLFLNTLQWEITLIRIKIDPLSYTDSDNETVASFARALVS